MGPVGLARWRPHWRSAKAAGVSLAHYVRERGLSWELLYAARRTERDRRARGEAGDQVSPGSSKRASRSLPAVKLPFAPVAVRLPNDVALECQDFEADDLPVSITALSALPCSG